MLIIGLLIGLLVGHRWGWESAHLMVATECERNGGFFVGSRTFRCQPIDQPSDSEGGDA